MNIDKYPKFQRKGTAPGTYNKNLVYGSAHLKDDVLFPVTHSDPGLERLGHELARRIGGLHTSLTLDREQSKQVKLVPDSGTIQDGVNWLLPHVDRYNCISFDTESCLSLRTTAFAVFGAMDGFTLLVDYRLIPEDSFPSELRPLVHGRLVLGSRISFDSKLLRNVEYLPGEVQNLSKTIQEHDLYPYKTPPHYGRGRPGLKTGLKYLPEMLYGHHYGPLSSAWKGGEWVLNWYSQPFDWPEWLYPDRFYRFGTGRPKQEQVAYMRNDAVSPHIHVLLYSMLEVAAGRLSWCESTDEAVKESLDRFFGIPCTSKPLNAHPVPVTATKSKTTKKQERPWAPDGWTECGGIPPGVSRSAMLDALAYLPRKTLTEITRYMSLDLGDPDDSAFIEKYGGFPNLSMANELIQEHDLLAWEDEPTEQDQSWKQSDMQRESEAPNANAIQSKLLQMAHAVEQSTSSSSKTCASAPPRSPAGGPAESRDRSRSRHRRSSREPTEKSDRPVSSPRNRSVPSRPRFKANKQRSLRAHAPGRARDRSTSGEHVHGPECKRQRVSIDLWRCPGSSKYSLATSDGRSRSPGGRFRRDHRENSSSSESSSTSSGSSSSSSGSSSSSEEEPSEEKMDQDLRPNEGQDPEATRAVELLLPEVKKYPKINGIYYYVASSTG